MSDRETFEDELDDHVAESMKDPAYVLATLVALKDGPRDENYRATKDSAWQAAREVITSTDWLAARDACIREDAVRAKLREAAIDVHMWAHAMTTQKATAAATFAADRILELAGFTRDESDEAAREAHDRWLTQEVTNG